jgi:RNA polymerase sigma-70 factor (ECF subfamily)
MWMPPIAESEGHDSERRVRFRALFEREFDYVWASLHRLGVHPREIEDVCQEVFVRVYGKIDEYEPSRPIRPWLFAFAARCAADWRRLARHRVELLGVERESPANTPGADVMVERMQDAELVLRALEHIGAGRRAVFILHELDECPMKDIAESLGIPLFTGYSRLRVARDEFTTAVRRLQSQRGGK